MDLPIQIDKARIAAFCQRHHIVTLALFRSVLTERFTDESDVDVLVRFHPEHVPGMIRLCGMERELSEILGRKADMRTPDDLSRHFREEVIKTAVVQVENTDVHGLTSISRSVLVRVCPCRSVSCPARSPEAVEHEIDHHPRHRHVHPHGPDPADELSVCLSLSA